MCAYNTHIHIQFFYMRICKNVIEFVLKMYYLKYNIHYNKLSIALTPIPSFEFRIFNFFASKGGKEKERYHCSKSAIFL